MKIIIRILAVAIFIAAPALYAFAEDARGPSKLTKEKAEQIKGKIEALFNAKGAEAEKIMNELAEMGPESAAFIEAEIMSRRLDLFVLLTALDKVREKWGLKAPEERTSERSSSGGDAPEQYVRGKMEEAKKLFDSGDYKKASEIARAILVLEPSVSFRNETIQLITRCEEQFVQASIIQVTIETDNSVYETGADVEVRIRIANVSENDIEIRTASGAPLGTLSKTLQSYGINGDAAVETLPLSIDLAEDVKLSPKKAYVRRLSIPTKQLGENERVFRKITLSGSLRPGSIIIGGMEAGRALVLAPASFALVPKGYLDAAAKPLSTLKDMLKVIASPGAEKIENGSSLKLFLASCMVDDYRKEEAIDLVMKTLSKVGEYEARILMAALRRLSGEDLPLTVSAWEEWYLQRTAGPKK